jgi:iron complex outermembrane receptor protein
MVAALQPVAVAQETPSNQASDGSGIAEIIVTAQKFSESSRDTPLAITAITGEQLKNAGAAEISDLNYSTPNLSIHNNHGEANITLRGIGITTGQPGANSSVAYYIDGVYVSRPSSQLDSFFDVDRLEVVRGPQGTLYGRNATGGAINVITRDPTNSFQSDLNLSYGNYNARYAEGGIGGPLTDGLSVRVSFQIRDRDGYGWQGMPDGQSTIPNGPKNSVGFRTDLDDEHDRAIRLKLKYALTDNFSALFSADYFREDDASGFLNNIRPGDSGVPLSDSLFGGVSAPDPYRNAYGKIPSNTYKNDYGFALTLNWNVSPAFSLTSISGYRNTDYQQFKTTQSGTQLTDDLYTQLERGHALSEEIRASGKIDSLTYVLGAYAYGENQHIAEYAGLGWPSICAAAGLPYNTTCPLSLVNSGAFVSGYGIEGDLKTTAYAGFGQVGYELTDQLGVDAGVRYSYEKVLKPYEISAFDTTHPFNPANQAAVLNYPLVTLGPLDAIYHSVTPKATLRYKPANNILVYATYAQGFKSGGFSVGTVSPAFLPEKLTDYEVGLKGDWFNRHLVVDLSAYYYDYTNLQVSQPNAAGTALQVVSAGKARLDGVEFSIAAIPVEGLRLNLSGGLQDPKYKKFTQVNGGLIGAKNVYGLPASPNAGVLQDLSGKQLANAAKYNINVGAEYTWYEGIGNVTLRAESLFIDRVYFSPFNTAAVSQPAYSLFDASVRYEHPDSHWSGSLFADNIANKTYLVTGGPNSNLFGGWVYGAAGPPRTYGVRVSYKY